MVDCDTVVVRVEHNGRTVTCMTVPAYTRTPGSFWDHMCRLSQEYQSANQATG